MSVGPGDIVKERERIVSIIKDYRRQVVDDADAGWEPLHAECRIGVCSDLIAKIEAPSVGAGEPVSRYIMGPCPKCGGTDLTYMSYGCYDCYECGIVYPKFSENPEWKQTEGDRR